MLNRREFLAAAAALPALAQDDKGLVVHEWGVVTAPYGSDLGVARSEGARFADGKELAEELPDFVTTYREAFDQSIEEWKNRPVRKPIVYFYAKERTNVRVKVSVPRGRPHAWWPPTADYGPRPALPGKGIAPDPKIPAIEDVKPENGHLTWNFVVDPDSKARPRDAAGWWPLARKPASTPIRAGTETDTFLFYDALTRFDSGLTVAWTAETVTVEPAVFAAVHVRKGRCRYATGKGGPLKEGTPDLSKALVEAGLTRDEAEAVVEIWRDEFFKTDGAR